MVKKFTKAETDKIVHSRTLIKIYGRRDKQKQKDRQNCRVVDLLTGPERHFYRDLLFLLTGHCNLNRHLKLMGFTDEAMCRFRQSEEETIEMMFYVCSSLV